MSVIGLDPQANGWVDDGTESGVIRTRSVRSDLVRVPFRDGHITYNGSSAIVTREAWQENADGSASGFLVSVAAAATAPAIIEHLFYGRVYGIRLLQNYNSPNIGPGITDFGINIDGKSYPVSGAYTRQDTNTSSTFPNGEAVLVIADDLPNGPHKATLIFPAHPTINAQWGLLGFAAERAAGYEPLERVALFGTSAVLGTSDTALSALYRSSSVSKTGRGVYGAVFYNSTASPVIVTIKNNATDIYALTVPANGSADWTLPHLVSVISANLKFRAATATAVTVTVIEGQ